MPKFRQVPATPQKTEKQELKEILQAPDDPLCKYPLRALGYSNEVGAAVSAMPGWGKTAETALWIPALMYLGADIYDKYKRGKDGNYSKESATKAVEQAVFQALASVILPTAAVRMGQGVAAQFTKFDGNGLSANVKEELLDKLERDFLIGKFTKGDRVDADGVFRPGKAIAIKRIKDNTFLHELGNARKRRSEESVFRKLLNFFGHPGDLHASAKTDEKLIKNYLTVKAGDIFDKQTLVENNTLEEIEQRAGSGFANAYKKAAKKAERTYQKLIEERPFFVLEKIMCTPDERYKALNDIINTDYSSISKRKDLVNNNLEKNLDAAPYLKKLMQNPKHKELIEEIAKKAEISKEVVGSYIRNKKLKMGMLKTVGGFVALGFLAVPIDHFVHNYIIKKCLEPGLENVKNFHSRLSFKKSENK